MTAEQIVDMSGLKEFLEESPQEYCVEQNFEKPNGTS